MHYVWLIEVENENVKDSKEAIRAAEDMLEAFAGSLYDWYEIGGRWDNEIANNCCKGSEIKEDFIPFGIIKSNYEVIGEDDYFKTIYRMKKYNIIDEETYQQYLTRMGWARSNEVEVNTNEIRKSDNYYVCVDMHN